MPPPTDSATPTAPVAPFPGPTVFGHPRGLATLFFTEMWERFSYYGMRALLVLFMVDAVRGGMGMTDKMATSIYALYTATVYLVSLPGGWFADRVVGARRAVWIGGIIIAVGHFTLAIPRKETFFLGLVLVALGSGTLKPNMSALVGELYPEGGTRRDSGFTIFYMGVNLGAFIGPLVCSTLGEQHNWHYGFAAAGVGMVLGLTQFRLTGHWLGPAGLRTGQEKPLSTLERGSFIGGLAVIVLVVGLGVAGIVHYDPVAIAQQMTKVIVSIAVLFFAYMLFLAGLDKVEKKRVGVILVLCAASALFWAGFEQAGSSFNLFAERYTQRHFAWCNTWMPGAGEFSPGDIIGPDALAAKLSQGAGGDLLTRDLAKSLSDESKGMLAKYAEAKDAAAKNEIMESLKQSLVQDLNRFTRNGAIYTPERFAGVKFAEDTAKSMAGSPGPAELRGLNKLLLTDAYPAELAKPSIPTGWFQALGPIFVISLAPVMAALWVWLGRRNLDPSIPVKFGLGLILLGLGFVVMAGAAAIVVKGPKVMPTWLTLTYLIHTFGELCVSPVGLSSVTKLAPRRFVGQMMGAWFLATSLGDLVAGLIASGFDPQNLHQMPSGFMQINYIALAAGISLIIFSRPVKGWMAGVK